MSGLAESKRAAGSKIAAPPRGLPGWLEIPLGGILVEPGNAVEYKTGSWRTRRPIHDSGKCTSCMICWLYCPDDAIVVRDRKVVGIDRDHCKGCGICARECPVKGAMTMAEGGAY